MRIGSLSFGSKATKKPDVKPPAEPPAQTPAEPPAPVQNGLAEEIKLAVSEARHPPGFLFPDLMTILVDDKVVGAPSLEERRQAGAGNYTNILFWCNNLPKAPSWALANHIYSMKALPKKAFLGITEKSEGDVSIGDMHKMIHALGKAEALDNVAMDHKNLLIVLDPKHALPVLVRMRWPNTRIVGVFSKPPRVSPRYLEEFDCIIACPSIMPEFGVAPNLPLVFSAASLDQVAAHIRAYYQTSSNPQDHFYFSLRGKTYEDNRVLRDGSLDLIFVSSGLFKDEVVEFSTFDEYLKHTVSNSDDILLHSKWLYNVETLLIKERWFEICARLLKLGARTATMDKDSLPCM